MADSTLILYTTLGCHLCEQAKEQVWPLLADSRWRLKEVDIADSDALVERYGVRIPVIARADTGAELGWPFAAEAVERLLSD